MVPFAEACEKLSGIPKKEWLQIISRVTVENKTCYSHLLSRTAPIPADETQNTMLIAPGKPVYVGWDLKREPVGFQSAGFLREEYERISGHEEKILVLYRLLAIETAKINEVMETLHVKTPNEIGIETKYTTETELNYAGNTCIETQFHRPTWISLVNRNIGSCPGATVIVRGETKLE